MARRRPPRPPRTNAGEPLAGHAPQRRYLDSLSLMPFLVVKLLANHIGIPGIAAKPLRYPSSSAMGVVFISLTAIWIRLHASSKMPISVQRFPTDDLSARSIFRKISRSTFSSGCGII